jgi:hypothetical protein
MFRPLYFVYCLCVNVYCTAATGRQPNCSYIYIYIHTHIYIYIYIYIYTRGDCHSVVFVNGYEWRFSISCNGFVPMLHYTFAKKFQGLNVRRNRDLKRLWRVIFNSGGSKGGLSVLPADVDWKCKLFPVEMCMNLSQVCLNWMRTVESETKLSYTTADLKAFCLVVRKYMQYLHRTPCSVWESPVVTCLNTTYSTLYVTMQVYNFTEHSTCNNLVNDICNQG